MTQLVSSTARAIVDTVRTVFVWLFFLIPSPIRVEGGEEEFHFLQFFGFILLIAGTLIYNEIVELNFWNLDYYTRRQIAKRETGNTEPVEESEENRLYRESNTATTQE